MFMSIKDVFEYLIFKIQCKNVSLYSISINMWFVVFR